MPWCPRCKCEYRAGFIVCADCGEKLVEHLEPETKTEAEINDEWALFFQTNDEREAEIIESILNTSDIPFLRKDKGAGGYLKVYMGMTNMGIDIYVPYSRLNDAKDLIPPSSEAIFDNSEEEIVLKSNKRSAVIDSRRKKRTKIVVMCWWILPFIILLLILFWNSIKGNKPF